MKIDLFILHNRHYLGLSLATMVANLMAWIVVFLAFGKGKFNIILHYSTFFGVDFKGSAGQVFTIPLIGSILFILNIIIARFVYKRDPFSAYLLLSASFVSQIFVLIAIASIIMINNPNFYQF